MTTTEPLTCRDLTHTDDSAWEYACFEPHIHRGARNADAALRALRQAIEAELELIPDRPKQFELGAAAAYNWMLANMPALRTAEPSFTRTEPFIAEAPGSDAAERARDLRATLAPDATARLAAALLSDIHIWTSTETVDGDEWAAAILAADPALGRAIELGRAFEEVEAALPEGHRIDRIEHLLSGTFGDWHEGDWRIYTTFVAAAGYLEEADEVYGETLLAALLALAARLSGEAVG